MSNEAAARLRQWLAVDGRYVDAHPTVDNLVDAALAAERRVTVERIEKAVVVRLEKANERGEVAPLHEMLAYLEREAAR